MRIRLELHKRIFLNFVLVITLLGILGAVFGAVLINRNNLNEAQRHVSIKLRTGWSVLSGELDKLRLVAGLLGADERVIDLVRGNGAEAGRTALEAIRMKNGFDFLMLTDASGCVLLRTTAPYASGDQLANDPCIRAAMKGQSPAGFALLSAERLRTEGGDLAERAFIVFEPTPKAKPRAKQSESAGMVLIAAAPVSDRNGRILGTVCAGILLNRNHALVDRIRAITFEDQTYGGKPLGSVTVFQWDTRIATNVMLPNGNRAIATRVSEEVYDKVLENNSSWYDRAFVVNDWYISAYDPIHDLENKVIGILYVGILAKKYDDIKYDLWKVYGLLTGAATLLVFGLGLLFSRRLTGSLTRLAEAAGRISGGELGLSVPEPSSNDEVLDLTRAFNTMAASLRDREARLNASKAELEEANKSLQKLNASYLDMLGFVSHELKNALGVIFTSARALEIQIGGSLNESQTTLVRSIVNSIRAAVKMTRNYLDMARMESGELKMAARPLDFARDVVQPVLREMESACAERRVAVDHEMPSGVPEGSGDPDLLQTVLRNLLDNALKYGREGGRIRVALKPRGHDILCEVWNEGEGLPEEQVQQLFTKFTRFHRDNGSRSSGLGLYITREIIQKHGGRIWAESAPGRWISFFFTLPLALPPCLASAPPAAPFQAPEAN